MNKKRNKLEMIRDMLLIVQKARKIRITPLIYKANLSSNSIKPYINDLLKKGLMQETIIEEIKYFIITPKGNEFLQEFSKIKIFAESYGLQEV